MKKFLTHYKRLWLSGIKIYWLIKWASSGALSSSPSSPPRPCSKDLSLNFASGSASDSSWRNLQEMASFQECPRSSICNATSISPPPSSQSSAQKSACSSLQIPWKRGQFCPPSSWTGWPRGDASEGYCRCVTVADILGGVLREVCSCPDRPARAQGQSYFPKWVCRYSR